MHIAEIIGEEGAIKNTASGIIPKSIGIKLITMNLRLLIFSWQTAKAAIFSRDIPIYTV